MTTFDEYNDAQLMHISTSNYYFMLPYVHYPTAVNNIFPLDV